MLCNGNRIPPQGNLRPNVGLSHHYPLHSTHTAPPSPLHPSPMGLMNRRGSSCGLEKAIETYVVDGDAGQQLQSGNLYAILTSRNEVGAWNWSFFVPNDKPLAGEPIGSDGVLFHAVMDAAGNWEFGVELHYNPLASQLTVAIVKLTDLDFMGSYEQVIGEDGLLSIFRLVPIPELENSAPGDFSSRTWFLEGIGTLGDCGILTCDDVWLLEREIRRCAFLAMDNFLDTNNRRLQSQQSQAWTLYIAQHCS